MMATGQEWARAFAKQAKADWDAWNALQIYLEMPEGEPPIPMCQKLHFLQMACEKLAKAHRFLAGDDPDLVVKGHGSAGKHFGTIFRQMIAGRPDLKAQSGRYVLSRLGPLAREIELLTPALKAGGKREDNCEYPWEDGTGKVQVPAELTFSIMTQLLTDPAGRLFLKLVRESALGLLA